MGASGWNYFVPYQTDVEATLESLRRKVFQDGSYGDPMLNPERTRAMFEEMLANSPNPDQDRPRIEAALAQIAELQRDLPPEPPKPDTIEELVAERAESGTHSILDIDGIASEPEFRMVCPLPIDRLRARLDTDKPTRELVESRLDEIMEDPIFTERWHGAYFTVYLDDKPHEICFLGVSGD